MILEDKHTNGFGGVTNNNEKNKQAIENNT